MNFCPFYKNKDVFDGFNEIIESLGGRPMTAEEFKSADLRNQRSGLDYAAMESAYEIYDKNNGNFVDFAPNGQPSELFADILKITGNRNQAIAIKAQIYSDKFLSERLNWLQLKDSFDTDINGEPLISFLTGGNVTGKESPAKTKAEKIAVEFGFDLQLHSVNPETFFGGINHGILNNGNQVSSKSILEHLINSKQIPAINSILADVLSKHDIPVLLGENEVGKPMQIIQKDGGFVIIIDQHQIRDLRAADASNMFMHEVVHALTSNALESPKTLEEQLFVDATKSVYSFFDKAIPEYEISRTDSVTGAYILKDIHEFASEFATNRSARQLLFEKAVEIDKQTNGKALLKIKKFINAFSNLLFNKKIFKLKQDEFKAYKNLLDNFLVHRAIINRGNITDTELLQAVYSQVDKESDDRQINATRRARMIRYFDDIISRSVETVSEGKEGEKDLLELRSYIATSLNTRILGIQTSKMSEEDKIRYKEAAQSQIDMLTNKNLKSIMVLSQLVQQVIPQLLEDIDDVRKLNESDDSYYMYQAHDNFGTYAAIFTQISKTLSNPEYISQLKKELEESTAIDKLGIVKNIQDLKSQVSSAMSVAVDGVGYMNYILTNNLKKRMGAIAKETGSTELAKWLDEMKSIGYDTNWFLMNLGAKDGSSDTTVRAIMYMINKANRAKDREVYKKAIELTKLTSQLKSGESIKDIYEYDDNGLTTGNIVRSLNYGKQKKAYKDAIKQINKLYGLPEDNVRIPDDNKEVVYKSLFDKKSKHNYKEDPVTHERIPNKMSLRRAWNLQKNEWLSKNVERKYKSEYYDAYAGLSEETLEAINSVRDRINQIKAKAKQDDAGHYMFDTLSEEDWKILSGLYIERRSLSSFININGTLKVEGTPEYNIAKELQELNSQLYDKNREYHDKKAWALARNKVLQEAIKKHTDESGDVNEDAVKRIMKKWDKRNSRRKYKTDIEGNALIYKQIDEDLYEVTKGMEEPIFDFNGDGGERYKANKKRISDTLNIFKDSNTDEVNLDFLPASVKKKIISLQKENEEIKNNALKNNKELKQRYKEYQKQKGKIYKKYFVSRATDQWLSKYEITESGEDFNIDGIDERLPRWATKLIVRDVEDESGENMLEKYTELVPGDGWITNTERDDLINPEYERLSKEEGNEGMSMIPKKSLYDNSLAYNKIKNSKSLKVLYDAIVTTMQDANSNFYNGNYKNAYQLPQITGSMFKYMSSTGVNGAMKYISEQIGYVGNGEAIRQDEAFGMAISAVLGDVNVLSEAVKKENDISASRTVGTRADGRQFNIIPPRYTTPLEDPSLISSDLIGIVCEYYDSAMNTKYKDEIKDTIESFMDMLENRKYVEGTDKGQRKTEGKDTYTYKSARKAVDMFLYGIKTESVETKNWNFSKTAQLAKQATTAINLGGSPVVALTGFFTSSYAHLINSIVGNKAYGFTEAVAAAGIVLWSGVKRGFNFMTGNKEYTDQVKELMRYFNISNQLERKYKKSNQNKILMWISNNYIFGMLSQLDYIIKANIAVSLCLSHKLVDGKFVAKEDIRNRARNLSSEQLAEQIKKWNEGVSVWNIMKVKDGKLSIDEEYKEAFSDVENVLYNRIIKCAENADGVATETQKAAISTNIWGAAILVHRQYLPLQIQDRYAKTVYDMDTQLFDQGMFRTVINTFTLFALQSIRDAYIAQKAESDYHWFSAPFNRDFYKNIVFNSKFYKQIASDNVIRKYKNYFYDDSSDESYMLSRARRKHLKKFGVELIMFYAAFQILMPLLYTAADDKKNKDKLLLQLAAYTARRVEWESFNPYRLDDMYNNINTVTAETSLLDKIETIATDYSPRGNLFSTLFNSDPTSEIGNYRVKRGVYKGWDKTDRDWFKLLMPYHNAYEQIYGSKEKRRYYENRIMQIKND